MIIRKLLSAVLAVNVFMASCVPALQGVVSMDAGEVLLGDYRYSEDVTIMQSAEISNDQDNSQLQNFLIDGGIIVVKNDRTADYNLGDVLGMSISIDPILESDENSPGVDIATIYYKFADTIDGVYIINVNGDTAVDEDALINEAVAEIRMRKDERNLTYDSTLYTAATATGTEAVLGIIDIMATSPPYGKLHSIYEIYTVQDYSSQDYYWVKASLFGYPGAELSQADTNYGWQYVGTAIDVEMSTPTSSVTVRASGPQSTANTTTFTVDLGGQLGFSYEDRLKFEAGLGVNFAWSWNIEEVTVVETGSTTRRNWAVAIGDAVDERYAIFKPGIAFECPYTKTSVDIDLYAVYNIESFWVFNEEIVIDRTVRCTASNATLQ